MAIWHVNDPGNIGPRCYNSESSSSGSNSSSISSSSSSESIPKQGIRLNLIGVMHNCHGGACEVEIDSIGHIVNVKFKSNLTFRQPESQEAPLPLVNVPPLIGHYEWRVNDPDHDNPEELPIDLENLCTITPIRVLLDIRCGPPPSEESSSQSSSSQSSSLSSSSLSSSSSQEECDYTTQGTKFLAIVVDRDQCAAGAYMLEIDSIGHTVNLVPPSCSQVTKRVVTDIYCDVESSSTQASMPKIEYTTVIFPAGYMFCTPQWREVGCCWYVLEQWIYPIAGTAFCSSITQQFTCGEEATQIGEFVRVGCPENNNPS